MKWWNHCWFRLHRHVWGEWFSHFPGNPRTLRRCQKCHWTQVRVLPDWDDL